MNTLHTRRGFTLIELLIVGLIITILTTVAWTQYNRAIIRARTSAMFPLLKNVIDAETMFYLDHGDTTYDLRNLDVNVLNSCQLLRVVACPVDRRKTCTQYKCGSHFVLDFGVDMFILNYCPHNNNDIARCIAKRDYKIEIPLPPAPRVWRCTHFSSLGKHICEKYFK